MLYVVFPTLFLYLYGGFSNWKLLIKSFDLVSNVKVYLLEILCFSLGENL